MVQASVKAALEKYDSENKSKKRIYNNINWNCSKCNYEKKGEINIIGLK